MAKLLIVDDEIDIREFAKNFFKRRNIEVFTAAGGDEALKVIEREKPDLVLLDIYMEEITGVEVLKKLREGGNNVKVIMVTGVEDKDIVNKVTSYGIKGYIHKPLILKELEDIVMSELNE